LFGKQDEVNLSMLWALVVVGFALKNLWLLTRMYFTGSENAGERSMCILCGVTYWLISMAVLLVDEDTLELGLNTSYQAFNQSAAEFLGNQTLHSTGPVSLITFKVSVSVWCAIIGAFLTFPGLRLAKMHLDGLKYCEGRNVVKLLMNISFISPFLLTIMWLKPVSKDYCTRTVFPGMTTPLMSVTDYESLRLWIVVMTVVLRLCMMPQYLQAYLNMSQRKIDELKKQTGRIKNTELQRTIASVFYYLCVVTMQYVAPLILGLYFAFMMKTLGGYKWVGWVGGEVIIDECSIDDEPPPGECGLINPNAQILPDEALTLNEAREQFALKLSTIRQIFNEEVLRGMFGFATWWTCFMWFCSSALGFLYHEYFAAA